MTGRRLLVAIGLVVLAAVGVFLVVTGGDDPTPAGTASSPSTPGTGRPTSTLPLKDTSLAAVEQFSGLAVPASATDLLTARLENDRQLDLTFVMPADAEEEFLTGSGLPPLTADNRVVIHSSPLWKLNPGVPLRGVADVRDGVNRAVELVPEPDGRIRARITLQAV
ncbi:MAG: hypothetical protein ACOYOP_03740 [Microthrixaceae bacterium]